MRRVTITRFHISAEIRMHATLKYLVLMSMSAVVATGATAQSAKDILGLSPLLAIVNQPSTTLIVDAPLAEPLALCRVFILVGMLPGPHTVLFELADPTHQVITSETLRFVVPTVK